VTGNLQNLDQILANALDLQRNGNFEQARAAYLQVLAIEPEHFAAHTNLGLMFLANGQWKDAETHIAKAILTANDKPLLYFNLGVAIHQQGRLTEAIACYQEAIRLKNDYTDAYCNVGVALKSLGKLEEAAVCYRQAVMLQPELAVLHSNLGVICKDLGDFEEAIRCYEKAIVLQPDLAEPYSNLGSLYRELGRFEEAVLACRQSIAKQNNFPPAHQNLGLALYGMGQFTEAIQAFRTALSFQSVYPEAHLSLAVAYLLMGDYQTGLSHYEWRMLAKPELFQLAPPLPLWRGPMDACEELILVEEQGIGDIIQFMRYGKLLKQNFPFVTLAVRDALRPLVKQAGIFDQVYSLSEEVTTQAGAVRWTYLLSVLGVLGVSLQNPQVVEPYLPSNPERDAYWAARIKSPGTVTVGLNWQGNPEIEKSELLGRSLPLSALEPLAAVPGLQFVSLQKGHGSEQLENCTFKDKLAACQPEISEVQDWVETASIVQNCDLVITSDTAIAHLAGAMGKPVWILLTKIPDWRWGLDGENCPWYPSARLFRQKEAGNWAEVMTRVKNALMELHKAPD